MSGGRDPAGTAERDQRAVEAGFAKMGIDRAERHAFLCVGPDCCSAEAGLESWDELKREIAERKLPVLRTKAACFRICSGGPWLVVYPEGVWYGAVTVERVRRIAAEHLVGGRPVTEWVDRVRTLPGVGGGGGAVSASGDRK